MDTVVGHMRSPRFRDEFGSWDNLEERSVIEATSPFQNLRGNRPIPPVLITTNTTDPEVNPRFAREYALRLQNLGYRFFYREHYEGGHSYGSTPQQVAAHQALVYSFFWKQLSGHSGSPKLSSRVK
jgi:prolyl oligopeptidase